MKVFNLTDVQTPQLKQRHMKSQTIVIHGRPIAPGGSQEYDKRDTSIVARAVHHYVKDGALAIDELPPAYTKAKAAAAVAPAPATTTTTAPATTATPATTTATAPVAAVPAAPAVAATPAAPAAPVESPAAPPVPTPPASPTARIESTADIQKKAPDPTKAGQAPVTKKG
jgi:translation initiation factor IF-2